MKKTPEKLHDNETKKMTERSFIFNITACILGVVICLASLSAVTWAWFSSSVSSTSNDLQAGNYSVEVEIAESDAPSVKLVADDNGIYTLEDGKKYSVTITGDGTVSTGFCMLEIESGTNTATKWYTEQIYTDHIDHAENNATEKKAITFEIQITGGGTLKITSYWGKYNSATVFDGASYVYNVDTLATTNGTVSGDDETTAPEKTTTTEETTAAEETTTAEETTAATE